MEEKIERRRTLEGLSARKDFLKALDKKVSMRKWKRFSKMNEEEKRERIQYLWGRVRSKVKQIGMVYRVQHSLESNFTS